MKENENESAWSLELGFYPGVLLGFRSYEDPDRTIRVLYLPLVDLALTVYK